MKGNALPRQNTELWRRFFQSHKFIYCVLFCTALLLNSLQYTKVVKNQAAILSPLLTLQTSLFQQRESQIQQPIMYKVHTNPPHDSAL